MKYLVLVIITIGCGPSVYLSTNSPIAIKKCEEACNEKYGNTVHCDGVGPSTGNYFCK